MVLIRQLICSFFLSSSFFRCFGIPFTSSSSQTQQTDLPSEIITEILLRLPVKSLLRFRCVSKSWRSLISQPEFAKTHLSLASMNTDYTHHKLILLNKFSIDIKSCSLHSILNKQSCIGVELDCPLKVAPATIVGCVDGLVCIAAKWDVYIWNPATRKSKKMPSFIKPCYSSIARYGFGYDESTDDYKVVILTRCAEYTGVEPEVKVCTLRTASWRRIGGFPYRLLPDGSGIFLSGMLHWFLSGESNRIIVSLDLVKETYGEVPEPDYDEDERLYENRLDVLNGWLCILRTGWDRAEVWVMKEYGVGESWTKLLVIPYMPPPRDYMHSPPLCILEKNGEFLFHLRSEFVLRNPKDGIVSYPMIRNCSSCSTVHLYVESLVSPVIDADSGV